jgi:stage II sporulation protein AA (anti-sigma F factor antagonist)
MISLRRVDEDVVIICPERVLDNDNAHEMSGAIIRAQSAGYRYIILNLSGLEFISSAGVGSILGSVESSRAMGGDIILCSASEKIRHIFEILDLCDFLTMVDSEETAMGICHVGR